MNNYINWLKTYKEEIDVITSKSIDQQLSSQQIINELNILSNKMNKDITLEDLGLKIEDVDNLLKLAPSNKHVQHVNIGNQNQTPVIKPVNFNIPKNGIVMDTTKVVRPIGKSGESKGSGATYNGIF